MSSVIEPTDNQSSTEDTAVQRILLEGVPWERYEQLSACFPDSRALRLTYIDGSLEIMSPVGPTHENRKQGLRRFLSANIPPGLSFRPPSAPFGMFVSRNRLNAHCTEPLEDQVLDGICHGQCSQMTHRA